MNPKSRSISESEGSANNVETMRHSASHVLAQAVSKLFPGAKLGIGPAIEHGFYYDFELSRPLKDEDLVTIEQEMIRIIKEDLPIIQVFRKREDVIRLFEETEQVYKLDLLKEIPDKELSTFVTGSDSFIDLCRGPHVASTGKIGAIKVDRIAGAYWHGDENQPMLQRIYGLAFPTDKELQDYIDIREQLKEIDHRKLGKEMDLFSFHDESPGNAFWHPKGLHVMQKLMDYWRQVHEAKGYVEVRTPVLLTCTTWKQSGHLDNFREKMYMVQTFGAKTFDYAVKPMNCDGGIQIFKNSQHSYKEFPIRMGELGVVHRYESSGETHGLMRVREFTQDDAHIFCTPDQVRDELKGVIHLCVDFYKTFDLPLHHIELSTRPEKSTGSDEIWEKAESLMRQVLEEEHIPHRINEGDGAFYGPKFDFHLQDSVGRTWQCGTIQLDFAQPENFDLDYIDEKGEKARPVMIHRVVYGSIERFMGILLENCGGVLPLWLSPEPVRIVPIADRHEVYADKIAEKLKKVGIVATVDTRGETMQHKIRDAEVQKVPYVVVVGDKERETSTVSVRPHGKKDTGMVDVRVFIKIIQEEIKTKTHV